MTCHRVQEHLSDYIDGELSSAAVLGVQAHLKHCEACEIEHQALRRTVQLVALFGRQEAPIDCREAVMARLKDVPAPAPRVPSAWFSALLPLRMPVVPTWARATALAGVAVAAVSAGTLMVHRPEEVNHPTPTVQLAQDDIARVRESSQLLQVLGRDDGYILAADFGDWSR
jgi:anti-sigma factor RsiW